MTAPLRYQLQYTVPAWTRLEAIFGAARMLRTGVHVREVTSAEPAFPGYYLVTMAVEERFDDPAEPEWDLGRDPGYDDSIDAAKREADRAAV